MSRTRFLSLFALCATSLSAQPPTVIVGAKLIDGMGGTPVENSVVIIENGRIRAAGPRAQVTIPAGSVRVEGSGKVIIPGLIDVHCHYAAPLEDFRK